MTVWYRFLLQVLSGWRITPPYASFYKRNTFNVDLMQIQQLLCLQKSTLNVFFNFFCSRGWSEGACFLHLLREDHRSSLKVENFLPKGVSFYPSISPFTMRAYEGYACKSLLPTNGEGGKSLEEENILSETGIIGPAFSPFIMKGYAGHLWRPHRKLWTKCELFA